MSRTSEPLLRALNRLRSVILDPDQLVKAVASGKQRGTTPPWRRAELRYVDLKAGRHLQITTYDATQAFTANHPVGSTDALDALLDLPFANWTVTTPTEQIRVQAKTSLTAFVTTTEQQAAPTPRTHDQAKERLLPEDDELFRVLGLSDKEGRLKPSRQAKFRQVEEFLRQLDAAITDASKSGKLRTPTSEEPLRIVDLGCGNGYLTFAAQRYLTEVKDLPVVVTGVDVKQQSRDHNSSVAAELGINAEFVVGTIGGVQLAERPDVVLALHACDTATDDALARAVEWETPLVLAAPCCHHDIAAQLRKAPTPAPYAMLTRHGILRERFADTLTDALRASLLRLAGYRVEVVEFVESQHTPRNTMLRAVRTGGPVKGGAVRKEYDDLVTAWGVRPQLGELLGVSPQQ
ncbi:SAM-dependent methyltransferase [Nocardioides sp. DS6]|uniref:SAM-dependent methyltransferase n=1 Tax=Nocardioides eburneus TaxID=3231482 RepID=A0ABV3SYQ3_9ACTN